MKRGSGACDAPRLNARRFEEQVVERIRSNILTESCMSDLVKQVAEEMDGVTAEQLKRLLTIEAEIAEVKRQLGRLWRFIETSDDVDVADLSARILEHRAGRSVLRKQQRTPVPSWTSADPLWATPAKLRNTPERWTTSWIVANLRNAGLSSSRSSGR